MKTLARAIYHKMESNRQYSTNEILNLLTDEEWMPFHPQFPSEGFKYFSEAPEDKILSRYKEYQAINQNKKSLFLTALYKMEQAGFVQTELKDVSLYFTRGKKFGSKIQPTPGQVRIWVRVK